MALKDQFTDGELYNFSVFGDRDVKGGKVNGVVTPNVASMLGRDIHAEHTRIYNQIADVAPDDPMGYNYLLVEIDGRVLPYGLPWIKGDTVVHVGQNTTRRFVVENIDPSNDPERIIRILNQAGYSSVRDIG